MSTPLKERIKYETGTVAGRSKCCQVYVSSRRTESLKPIFAMSTRPELFKAQDKASPGYYGPKQTAVLLLDFHSFFVEKAAGPGGQPAFENAVKLRDWAKAKGITVIHGLVDTQGTPFETCKGFDMLNNVLWTMSEAGGDKEPAALTKGAGEDEPTFTRVPGHVSALRSPGMQEFLTKKGIKSLVMCGLSTSGCVTRTAMAGTDAEFVVTVIADACADPSEGVHDMLVGKVLQNRSYVATADEFMKGFN